MLRETGFDRLLAKGHARRPERARSVPAQFALHLYRASRYAFTTTFPGHEPLAG